MSDAVSPRLWLVVALLLATELLVFNGMDITLGAFPLHAAAMGAGPALLGGLSVVWFLGSVLSRALAVRFSRRFGLWRLLLASVVVMFVGPGLYALARNPWELSAARILYAIGPACWMVAIPTLLASLVPARLRGNTLGWYGAVSSASLLYAPALGIALFERAGVATTYGVAALGGLLATGLALGGCLAAGWNEGMAAPTEAPPFRLNGQVRLGLLGALGVGACFSSVTNFLALYAPQQATDAEAALVVLAAWAVAARLLAGKLLDRIPAAPIAVVGSTVLMAGLLLLAWAPHAGAVLMGVAAIGAGQASGQTALLKHAVDQAGAGGGTAAVAWFFNATDVGMAVGALAFGAVAERFTYAAGYGVFAVTAACLALLVTRLRSL